VGIRIDYSLICGELLRNIFQIIKLLTGIKQERIFLRLEDITGFNGF